MSSGIPPRVMEYVERHLRSPAMRELMVSLLSRIASGDCVTWREVASTSVKLHFQRMRAMGLVVAVIRGPGRRACLEFPGRS